MAAGTDFFETSYVKTGLKKQVVRSGVFALVSGIVRQVIRIVSTVVIARLLTPEDFGLVAMIAAITGFIGQFLDLGLSQATVQRDELNHQQVTNLFWINVGLGLLLTVIVTGIAPVIVWFYHEPRLFWLTIASSAGFLFAGVTVQHQALIQRQLRMGTLAIIYCISSLLGPLAGVAAILMGAGVWGLIYMPLVEGFVCAAAVWLVCPWRPGLPARGSGTWHMLIFGGNLTGANIANYFSRNVDRILIGWRWSAQPLGLYDRAYTLMMFPLRQISSPISTVAIPTLSRLQKEPERYRHYYLKAISLIAFVSVPVVMFLIVMSDEVIRLVLGPKWLGASAIFAILGVCGLVQPFLGSLEWLYVSTGRTDRMFKATVVWSCGAVASFVIGLPFGPVGVAAAYTIFNLVGVVPYTNYTVRMTPVRATDVVKTLWPWFASGLIAVAILYVFKIFSPQLCSGLRGVVFGLLEVGIVYLIAVCVLAGGTAPLREIADLFRHLRQK